MLPIRWRLGQIRPFWRGMLHVYDRNVYLLLLFTFGKGLQISIGQVSTNLYVYSLGYPKDFVGLVAAMPAIGALVAAVPIGLIADRIGRKPLLLVSGLLNPLALVGIALSTQPGPLLIASLANGFLSSAYWVTNLPMLTESVEEKQRVGVLALNSFLLLGVGALGALIGGVVPEVVGGILNQAATSPVPLRFGVLAAAFVTFLPAIPLFWIREAPRSRVTVAALAAEGAELPPAAEPAVLETGLTPEGTAYPVGRSEMTRLFVKLLIPDFLATVGEGTVIGLIQLFFLLRFSLQPGGLGVILTVAGLLGGAVSLTAPRIVKRWGKLRTATTMQYLSAPVMLATGFAPVLALSASAEFSRIVLRGLFEPTYAAFALERVSSRNRATLSGFYSVTWSLGYSIGPTLAGWLQQYVSLSAPFIVGAVCMISAATLLRFFFGTGPVAPQGAPRSARVADEGLSASSVR
jgi:MFS family permease